ncbi:glycosyltransferase [Lactiplantibacillus plantarum]|uniref:glycosyltransferase n=1 Tax=Lactiplantibacillus TaxID=2767842 RepID=UPI0021A5204F|nr:glycosyltransferase [Lactiplantibacillus pentosus]
MTKVLVAAAFYPDDLGNKRLYFIHVRNLYYVKSGLSVTVLNFAADHDYSVDGIQVITLETYVSQQAEYDLLICHAANIRNHFRFLQNYGNKFAKIIFFFHGHEIMHISKYYPVPYKFKRNHYAIKKNLRNLYDSFKLSLWRRYFLQNKTKIRLVFVSSWLRNVFYSELKLSVASIGAQTKVIHNSVGKTFELNDYNPLQQKKYDFITIRNYMDDSKYSVDLVVEEARKHPEYKFCLIGRGEFFKHYEKPENLALIMHELGHEKMLNYLNSARCGFMPTREDTQGVMTCEIATFGLPVITSNIAVCREVFQAFKNVALVDNTNINLTATYEGLLSLGKQPKNQAYFAKNTVAKEIELIKEFV